LAAADPLELDLVERSALIALVAVAASEIGEEDEVPREAEGRSRVRRSAVGRKLPRCGHAYLSKMMRSGTRPSSPSGLSSVGRKMCSSLDSKSCGRFSPVKKNG
jgi:hypothetical protein